MLCCEGEFIKIVLLSQFESLKIGIKLFNNRKIIGIKRTKNRYIIAPQHQSSKISPFPIDPPWSRTQSRMLARSNLGFAALRRPFSFPVSKFFHTDFSLALNARDKRFTTIFLRDIKSISLKWYRNLYFKLFISTKYFLRCLSQKQRLFKGSISITNFFPFATAPLMLKLQLGFG